MDIEIIHAERVQLAFTGLVQWVRGLAQKWGPDCIVLEAIGTGLGFGQHLRDGLGMKNVHWVVSHGPNDKVRRMELASPKVEAGRVWLPYFDEFVQPFLDEVVQFPFAPCDDWADALSQLVLYFEIIWERARRYQCAAASGVRDGGWSPAIGLQERVANHRKRRWSKARVVSVTEKALQRRQVGDRKANTSEPPFKCRKRSDDVETGE